MSDKIALSWSRIDLYRQCPKKFKATHIDKVIEFDDSNPALQKGKKIHKELEDYTNWMNDPDGDPPKMVQAAKNAVPILKRLKAKTGHVYPEKQLALTHNWEKTDWFSSTEVLRYRAIIDALAFDGDTLIVIDHKSGKVREYTEDFGQLHLTAAILLSLYPKMQKVECSYLFVEHKKTAKITITRSQLKPLMEQFDAEWEQVNAETEWAPKKNRYCNWCQIKEDCEIYG